MDHMRDAREQILPGAGQQSRSSRHLAPARNLFGKPDLDIRRPVARICVRRGAKRAIMISVKMVVRVD